VEVALADQIELLLADWPKELDELGRDHVRLLEARMKDKTQFAVAACRSAFVAACYATRRHLEKSRGVPLRRKVTWV
jgi:hypothetical protein